MTDNGYIIHVIMHSRNNAHDAAWTVQYSRAVVAAGPVPPDLADTDLDRHIREHQHLACQLSPELL